MANKTLDNRITELEKKVAKLEELIDTVSGIEAEEIKEAE